MAPLHKILVMSSGSRGDIQPYAAMACALKQAGYHVECATCHNHAKLVTECGLPFHECFADTEKAVREQAALRKSMADGDAMAFMRALNEMLHEGAEPALLHWLGIVERAKAGPCPRGFTRRLLWGTGAVQARHPHVGREASVPFHETPAHDFWLAELAVRAEQLGREERPGRWQKDLDPGP